MQATDTTELLLHCARTRISDNEINQIKTLTKKIFNWEYLLLIAGKNRTIPLVYSNLNKICPGDIPKDHLRLLSNYSHNVTKNNLLLISELLRILDLFNSHKIPVISFKGPLMIQSLYKNPSLRESRDLDFLVHKKDIKEIHKLLISHNYRMQFNLKSQFERALLEYHDELAYEHENGLWIDIHTNIAPKYFFNNASFNKALWENLETLQFAGQSIKSISKEFLLLVLCIHGSKHFWNELRFIVDVSELINKNNLNWEKITNYTKLYDIKNIVQLGLFLAHDLLKAPLNENILEEVRKNTIIKKLACKVYQGLFNSTPYKSKFIEEAYFHLNVMGNPVNKVCYVLHLLAPSFSDWKMILLPKWLSFLYYFIRPIRLSFKFIKKIYEQRNKQ